MKSIQTFKHKTENKILEIFYDENPESPRELDNLGVIYSRHRNYNLQDKNANDEDLEHARKYGIVLNLYMYEHSGIALSTSNEYPFNDRWDAGQIGVIYVTREKILKEWKVKRISKQLRQRAINNLKSEIEVYSDYLNGNVYGFIESDLKHCNLDKEHKEHLNSCWGFYGYDMDKNGMWDYIESEKEEWLEQ